MFTLSDPVEILYNIEYFDKRFDVLEKNFFPNPYYGVEIRFVDE